MKKLLYVTTFLMCTALFAQNNTIPNGVYVPDELTNERVELHFNEGKFYVTMMGGIMEPKNDSLYFRSEDDSSSFKLQVTQSDAKAKKLTLVFKRNGFRYGLNKFYLGLQKAANAEIKYVRLDEILDGEEGYLRINASVEEPSAEVEKAAFVYLVHEDYRKNAILEKFSVPADAAEIEIDYREDAFKNLKLRGRYDAEKKAIIIKERSKEIRFVDKSTLPKIAYLTPDSVSNPKTFTYPGKEEDTEEDIFMGAVDSVAVDTAVAAVDYDGGYPQYQFKHTKVTSLEEGCKKLKVNQYLVMVFDESSRAQRNFDSFIKQDELQMSYRMYDGYDPDYDVFTYYLASNKDKSLVKKNNLSEETRILIFDREGNFLYSIQGSLAKNEDLFSDNSMFRDALQKAQAKARVDQLTAAKKIDLAQVKSALQTMQTSYKYAGPAYMGTVMDYPGVAVDSTYAYDEEYDDEERRFTKGTFYKMKTPLDVMKTHWAKIREDVLGKPVDSVAVSLLKTDLDEGVVESLYDMPKSVSDSDYKILDYIEKNYTNISESENSSQAVYTIGRANLILNVVQRFFIKNYASETLKGGVSATRVNAYYQKMLGYTNYDYNGVAVLLDELKQKNKEQFYQVFESFYTKLTDGNVYENMNAMFSAGQEEEDWTDYKMEIANLCNNTAWAVVEDNLDKPMVAKAVNWAELALKLNPNSNYTLDTCAHLYYRNGDIQKAILTEQKAVELSRKYNDEENVVEYGKVLEKMKNGTYGR